MLTTSELRRLVGRIRDRVHPDHIVLFGSAAKGTATARSDVDLLVVLDTWEPMHNRLATLKPLYATMTVPVDVHVYTPEEVDSYSGIPYHFLNTVMLTGRVLYSAPDARPLPRVSPDRTRIAADVGDVGSARAAAVNASA